MKSCIQAVSCQAHGSDKNDDVVKYYNVNVMLRHWIFSFSVKSTKPAPTPPELGNALMKTCYSEEAFPHIIIFPDLPCPARIRMRPGSKARSPAGGVEGVESRETILESGIGGETRSEGYREHFLTGLR